MERIPHDKLDALQFDRDERLEVWRQSVEPLFDCRAAREPGGREFQGRLESFNLGQTLIARSEFTPLHFQRDRRTSDDHLLVQLYIHGGYQGYNGDRKVQVGPGDISLLDMGLGLETLAPRSGTPLANILANHLSSVWETLADASVDDLPAINRTLVGAVAGAFCQGPVREDAAMPFEDAARDAVRAFIVHNLDDPGLGPARLCRRFGLSRTRLYRLFEPFGGVAGYIREQRLDRAFRELAERDLGQRRLVEVALECGFDSQSHFCRLFRQRFGMTPGEAMEQGRSARLRRSQADGDGPSRPEFRDWLLSL
ncbi:MAG TPA: hypothetical protein DCG45_06900 [Alcanivorax sp.]|nr:hypothetical protein [Alcanivorax sp.]